MSAKHGLERAPLFDLVTVVHAVLGYTQNQWPALKRYVEDGRLSISNSAAERAPQPIAMGSKHRLFFQREVTERRHALLREIACER